MIVFITGGVRSGKSRFAQDMALRLSAEPVYVATAKVMDEEFALRVRRHQEERGPQWTSIEQDRHIASLPLHNRTVVIDCVTLWLSGFFEEDGGDVERSLAAFRQEIDQIAGMEGTFIIISNELGMGLHAETAMGRRFTDLQGWANQYVASCAGQVIFMVSGLPLYLKNNTV